MANLVETSTWESGIYQWETTDPVEGGVAGIDNVPTRQLANRSLWLKDQIADFKIAGVTDLVYIGGQENLSSSQARGKVVRCNVTDGPIQMGLPLAGNVPAGGITVISCEWPTGGTPGFIGSAGNFTDIVRQGSDKIRYLGAQLNQFRLTARSIVVIRSNGVAEWEVISIYNHSAIPPGSVVAYAADPSTLSDGWLLCNGAAISRTTYADLFATIGTTFGAGNGTTTFNIPDLRGEFVRGFDKGRGIDTGRVFGSQQLHNVGNHTHEALFTTVAGSDGPRLLGTNTANEGAVGFTNTGGTDPISVDVESRPRNRALNYMIKY